MILIALGSNLSSVAGTPRETCDAALRSLSQRGIVIKRTSNWYETPPVPASDQPWFVNGVAEVETSLAPDDLMRTLLEIESAFARARTTPNAARTLDLDILDYNGQVMADGAVTLPHPRLQDRGFVLRPLKDVAPQWRHPVSGRSVTELLNALPQTAENTSIRPISATS
jgi:2-amino-4-hydroxy-6-hydroxymethyldihydropteridine diphosphokinase